MHRVLAILTAGLLAGSLSARAAVRLVGGLGDTVATVIVRDPGWVTQGIELAPGRATGGLKAGEYATQTDVLSVWGDRSIKMAAITYRATATGPVPITADRRTVGSLRPVWPTVVTTFTRPDVDPFFRAIGATYTAALGSFSDADCWFSGPLMVDCRKIVRSQTASGSPHPTLEVTYDIRSYDGGGHRVSVTIDNIYDAPGIAALAFDVDVSINRSSVYNQANVLLPAYVRGRAGTNSVHGKVFLVDNVDLGWASEDRAAMESAHAVPPYRHDVDADTYTDLTDTPNRYQLFQTGYIFPAMSAAGVREELSQWPDWCVKYLVHPNENRRIFMLAQAEAGGAWSYNLTRSRTTRAPVDLESVSFKFDTNAASGGADHSEDFRHIVPGSGADELVPASIDLPHFGGYFYFPWLVTADRFYADQLRFSAWYRIAALPIADRAPFTTEHLSVHITPEARGVAHSLREVHDASWLPTEKESGYWHDFFHHSTSTTLHTLDYIADGVSSGLTPVGGLELPSLMWLLDENHHPAGWNAPELGPSGEKMWGLVVWQIGKIVVHMDHAIQSGEYNYGKGFRDRALAWMLGQWRDGGTDYPRSYIGTYLLPVGYYTTAGSFRSYHYYNSWDQVGAAFRKYFDNHDLRPYGGDICTYGPHEYPALVIAIREGLSGAASALTTAEAIRCAGDATFLDKIKNDAAFAWRVP